MTAVADTAADLYERHRSRIYAFCLSRLGRTDEAEDAAQTTFLYALRCLQRGVVPRCEGAWLTKIAENVCKDRRSALLRRGRFETPADDELPERPHELPERRIEEISAALASMPDKQRRALLLREWRGLSYLEIADELRVSHSAVEMLVFRARRGLARRLQQVPQTVRAAFEGGSALQLVRSLLGSTAAKSAAAVATVAVASAVAGPPLVRELRHAPARPAAKPDPVRPQPARPQAAVARTRPAVRASAPAHRTLVRGSKPRTSEPVRRVDAPAPRARTEPVAANAPAPPAQRDEPPAPASAPAPAAPAPPAVPAPPVTVPSVTVPSVTVPSVTVPSIPAPSVPVPAVTVPAVTVPVVTTPTLPVAVPTP